MDDLISAHSRIPLAVSDLRLFGSEVECFMYLASGPHPLSRGIVQERAPLSPVIHSTSGAESREMHLIINGFLSRFAAPSSTEIT